MAEIVWATNRGRNGFDPPLEVGTEASVESRNVLLYFGGLGTKRGGATAITESGLSGHNALIEYVPGQDPTVAELWIVDQTNPNNLIFRGNTGSSSTAITLTSMTLVDVLTGHGWIVTGATLNGKLYLSYQSGINRIHVFDPGYSTTTVRRGGLAPFAAAPTAANTGSGSYAATLRYYAATSIEQRTGPVVIRRSELSASVSFTPSGSGTGVQITRPTAVGEGETHWEVYGSTDNVTFYGPLSTIAIGTTTYTDSSTPSTWATTLNAAPVAGQNTPFPSVKWLATDGTHLLGFGVWETSAGNSVAPKNGRVYFSPALDSSLVNDDERINNSVTFSGWIDISRNSNSVDVGISPRPVSNVFYVFQAGAITALVPTENATTPYRRVVVSSSVGALYWASIVLADDRFGSAACFFCDGVKGPYMVGGLLGLRWIGKDVKDVWTTVNKDASVPVVGVPYPDRNGILWLVATGASDTPNAGLFLDLGKLTLDEDGDLRGGWTTWTGDLVTSRCAVLFSNTVAATRSRAKVPYLGLTSGTHLYRYDETVQTDNGTTFQAYVTSGVLAKATQQQGVLRSYVRASTTNGVSLQQSLVRNGGDQTAPTSTVDLTPVGSQTMGLRKFDNAALQDADAIQVTLGDASALASTWQAFEWAAEITEGAEI